DLSRELEPAAAAALRAAARRAGVSLNTVVQAAWALVVARLRADSDVVFATTTSGRPESLAFDETAGLFIDTLPFRVQVPATGSIDAWLGRVQRGHGDVRLHGHVSIGTILGWSGMPAGTELCETLLVFENYPQPAAGADPDVLRIVAIRGDGARTRYPIAFLVKPSEQGLGLHLVYDRGRFDDVTAAAIVDGFVSAAAHIAAPGTRLEDLATDAPPLRSNRPSAAAERSLDLARPAIASVPGVEAIVRDVWEALFGRAIPPGASFADLGGHSMLLLQLVMRLRERFGDALDLATAASTPTVEEMAAVLAGAALRDRSPLVPLNAAEGDATPLVIVPGSSGNPLGYSALGRHMQRPVFGMRLVSGGPTSVVELAEQLVACLPDGRVHLAGHSFGAAVAFEAARLRAARGAPPGLLVLLDVAAPDGTPLDVPSDEAELLAAIADAASRFFGTPVDVDGAALAALDAPSRRAVLVERFADAGFVPRDTPAAFADELLSIYRASFAAYAAWIPIPIRGQEIVVVRAADGLAQRDHPDDPTLGWQHLSDPMCRCIETPGDHITMIAEPNALQLARRLNALFGAAP
nr:condensation domain-containing protein [Candidatus Eremiobacteraeota bacterium]